MDPTENVSSDRAPVSDVFVVADASTNPYERSNPSTVCSATVTTPHQMSPAAVSSVQVGVTVSAFVLTASDASDQSLSVSPFLASTCT